MQIGDFIFINTKNNVSVFQKSIVQLRLHPDIVGLLTRQYVNK